MERRAWAQMKDLDEPSEEEYSLTKVSAAVEELRAFKVLLLFKMAPKLPVCVSP